MKTEFLSARNNGDPEELEVLYDLLPYLKGADVIGDRKVSVIYLFTPDELPTHSYDLMGMGYNTSGRILSLKEGKVVGEASFDQVHIHREKQGLPDRFLNSPQTEISNDQDTCIIIADHATDKDSAFNGISLEVFVCAKGKTFGNYTEVRKWLAEHSVREKLKSFGIL